MDYDKSVSLSGYCPHHDKKVLASGKYVAVRVPGRPVSFRFSEFRCKDSRYCNFIKLGKCPLQEQAMHTESTLSE